jgi:hypothetical protein
LNFFFNIYFLGFKKSKGQMFLVKSEALTFHYNILKAQTDRAKDKPTRDDNVIREHKFSHTASPTEKNKNGDISLVTSGRPKKF